MSKSKITIKPSSLPMASPLGFIILLGLLLDRLAAPGWAWGVLGTVAVLLAIVFLQQRLCGIERDVPGFGDATEEIDLPAKG